MHWLLELANLLSVHRGCLNALISSCRALALSVCPGVVRNQIPRGFRTSPRRPQAIHHFNESLYAMNM